MENWQNIYVDKTTNEVVEYSEKWLPVVGWESLYEVSNTGYIRTIDRICGYKKNGGSIRKKSRIKKPKIDRYGYVGITLHVKERKLQTGVHTLVARAFIPNPENKPQVNHIDGNKLNNNDWNLEWSTNQENMTHAAITGLKSGDYQIGDKNKMAKLNWNQVNEMRKLYSKGIGQQELSQLYNITGSNVSSIVLNKSWKIKL